jgi:DNA-binding MarR family transcriptional regulator
MTGSKSPASAARILDELGELIRHLTRISGGAEDGPALTPTQRLALFELSERGPLRLNELAHRLGVSAPTATRAVDALESHGWAERVPDPTDRRAQRVDVTAHGKRRVEERKARVLAAFEPAAAVLGTDELAHLETLLSRLGEALGEAERTDDPIRKERTP